MKGVIAVAIFAILVVASLGVGYLAGVGSTHSETLTSTSTLVSTSTLASVTSGQPIPAEGVETAYIPVGGPVAGAAQAITVDSNTSRIYVAGGSSLTVINASSNSVITTVMLPATNLNGIVPDDDEIAIDYSSNIVYVSVQGGIAEVNGSTNTVVGELPLGLGPLAYDSSSGILYGAVNGTLVGVDVRTEQIVANISLGYGPDNVAVNPRTNMIYAVGCPGSFVCGSEASIVNATSGTIVTTVKLNSPGYETMTFDPSTNVVYISGSAQLVALNGSTGGTIFNVNSQTCSVFLGMGDIPSSNRVLAVMQDGNYLLVYDGSSSALVDMYSFPSSPTSVAYNPVTDELYMTTSGQVIAFKDLAATGGVNATLIGPDQGCPPP
jgi:hypothetical protein